MVAYSFQARFAEPILAGTKRQTIRADRKRHARPGEQLQLYTGMRTRSCRLLGRAECLSVTPVRIIPSYGAGVVEYEDKTLVWLGALDRFAQADGFAYWQDLCGFWEDQHPGVQHFSGVMIRWGDLLPPDLTP